jgi:uncharacterized membrane protein
MRLSFTPAGGYVLVVVVAIALVALLALGPGRTRTSNLRRRVLVALRLASIALVILAMLQPTLVWTTVTRRPATLLVLADSSRSMQVADVVGNKTRWQALRAALADAWPGLTDMDDELEIKLYTFDSQAHERDVSLGKPDLPETPDGDQTALGFVLDEVLRREAGKRIAAVVVLSDGAQRAAPGKDLPPQTPARRLADLGNPLFAVPFGQSRSLDQTRDVALSELRANQVVFVKNPLEVGGLAQMTGLVNQDVPVQLLVETAPGKMEVVAATTLRADAAGRKLPINLEYIPPTAGEIKVTLKALGQPGELVTTNNELSTFVSVLDGGLNVLYLNGAILPEQNFLRRSLDASPDINVDYQFLNARKPQTKPTDLIERFKPGKYNVYILGDLDSTAFTTDELTALRTAVEKGAGLIMLGGLHSFGAGGYGQTPLADVLPIKIDFTERQNFDEPIRTDLHLPENPKPRMRPTQLGSSRSPMLLAPAKQNAAAWEELPPLDGANRFAGIKPGAGVLAETTDGKPLLVAQEFGAGRVLAFAGDSTWHWVMSGHETAHKRFWRQVVLWLARKDDATSGSVWVNLDQRRFAPGGRVEFTAGAKTAEGEPVPDVRIDAVVVRPDGTKVPVRMRSEGGETAGTFTDALPAGDYTLQVTATAGTQNLGEARARFLVYEQDLELDNPAADRGALEGLAAMTGGKTLAPEQLPLLIEQIRKQLHDLEVETQIKETLWDNWPFFLLLVGVLGLEWFLRKKWGLV